MTLQHPSLKFCRSFSTTHQLCARSSATALAHAHRKVAPYPYGPMRTYKQSNFGLYGGSHIQFDNKVSEKNEIKTRRTWKPNIQHKKLWSDALNISVKVKVQARVLRTIDKVGGLDEYLLGGKAARIKELGMGGWKLRWRIMGTERIKERFAREREALGLVDKVAGVGMGMGEKKGVVVGRKDKETLDEVNKRRKENENRDRDMVEQKPEMADFMEESEPGKLNFT